MESTIAISNTAEAEVNAPEMVTVYSPDGEAIQVQSNRLNIWLNRGFSLQTTDFDAVYSELAPLCKALNDAWGLYLNETRENGFISSGSQDAAQFALDMLGNACNRLHMAIHRAYNPQGEE